MDYSWLGNEVYLEYLWTGFVNTLILVAVSGVLGFALAVGVALAQIVGPRPLAALARGFTTVIRGTPLLVQLFFFYDGVGRLLPEIPGVREMWVWPILRDAFFYGALAFTISVGAYAGEVMRGAMKSVPAGELEAARAFGEPVERVGLPQHAPRLVHEPRTDRRDADFVVAALEESHAEFVLELPDRDRQRRLAHVAGGGRATEMALAGDRDDVAEFGQGHGVTT